MSKKVIIDWTKWASIATIFSIVGTFAVLGAKRAFAINEVPEQQAALNVRVTHIESTLSRIEYNQTNMVFR